jgi:hypothetical protein
VLEITSIRSSRTLAVGEVIEGAVVEDVAVLVDLDERDALVLRPPASARSEMLDVDVDRARDEGRLAARASDSGLIG